MFCSMYFGDVIISVIFYLFLVMSFYLVEVPITFTTPLKDVSVPEDETVTLECEVSKPGQQVTWFRDGKKILKSESERKNCKR